MLPWEFPARCFQQNAIKPLFTFYLVIVSKLHQSNNLHQSNKMSGFLQFLEYILRASENLLIFWKITFLILIDWNRNIYYSDLSDTKSWKALLYPATTLRVITLLLGHISLVTTCFKWKTCSLRLQKSISGINSLLSNQKSIQK